MPAPTFISMELSKPPPPFDGHGTGIVMERRQLWTISDAVEGHVKSYEKNRTNSRSCAAANSSAAWLRGAMVDCLAEVGAT